MNALYTHQESSRHEDDDLGSWIFGITNHTTIGSLKLGSNEDVLLDSGSMVHACAPRHAPDVNISPGTGQKMSAVNGSTLNDYGTKTIRLDLGDSEAVPA